MSTKKFMLACLFLCSLGLLFMGCEKHVAQVSEEELPSAEQEFAYVEEHITNLTWDADRPCPEGLECWSLHGKIGMRCVDPNPREWFSCEEGTMGYIQESYPPHLDCVKQAFTYVEAHITDLNCDLNNPCPEGLECWGLHGKEGTRCVDPNPGEWFACEEGTTALTLRTVPPRIVCSKQAVTYVEEHITDLTCALDKPCPEGLECWILRGKEGPLCVDPNPAQWYCAEGTTPIVLPSAPPQLVCQ